MPKRTRSLINFLFESEKTPITDVKKIENKNSSSKLISKKSSISPNIKDNIGKKFGHLTILSKSNSDKYRRAFVTVQCDCGDIVEKHWQKILKNLTRTCGKCHFRYKLPPNIGITNLPEEIKAKMLKLVYSRMKSEAKRRNRIIDLSFQAVTNFILLPCQSCDDKWSTHITTTYNGEKYTLLYNGLDRIDNSRGYVPNNVITLCKTCNRMKLEQNLEEMVRRAEGLIKLGEIWLGEGYK